MNLYAQEGSLLDLHMHTTSSDGTDGPEELLDKLTGLGFRTFSVTDHDTYECCEKLPPLLADRPGIRFTLGVEFSCKDPLGKYHILGYHFDPAAASMRQIVEEAHDNRVFKVLARLRFLRENFHFEFSHDELDELMAHPNPGKPHIGNLMVKKGYAPDRTTAINDFINLYHGKTRYLAPDHAIQAILSGGGIPVLAHPIFGDGGQDLGPEELTERIDRLRGFGLAGLECYYSRNTKEQTDMLLALANERGMYATAGSDYHGKNKTVALGSTGLAEEAEPHPCFEKFIGEVFAG